jgi:hypothetical protein
MLRAVYMNEHYITALTEARQYQHPETNMAARLALRQLALLAVAAVVASYPQWPNPLIEALDGMRWDQSGAHSGFIGSGVVTCNKFLMPLLNGNQTNAAQWLRTVSSAPVFCL